MLPLYFPRSQSEEDFAAYHLPSDVGNEDGEPVIAERQIRIASKPAMDNSSGYYGGQLMLRQAQTRVNQNKTNQRLFRTYLQTCVLLSSMFLY